jgi:serine phosphatase RsbU (regulator of sigma subunit)
VDLEQGTSQPRGRNDRSNQPIPFPATPELVVVDPGGRQTSVPVRTFPFHIGRASDSHLVLHDSRVSRDHARFSRINGQFVIEDMGSRHGVWINGERIQASRALAGGERIEFGVPDGYRIQFLVGGTAPTVSIPSVPIRPPASVAALPPQPLPAAAAPAATSLEKLRSVLEIARSLQSSFSIPLVLDSVVDAAIAATGAERGFLLLQSESGELEVRTARSRGGARLPAHDLRVPRRLIQRALDSRRDLFTMLFDPDAFHSELAAGTVADLELRSVCCIPLVKVNLTAQSKTWDSGVATGIGVLYMDSRVGVVDLANGNRELLQTLAIEASTVLESAKLLADERARQHLEEELAVARRIQQNLLPKVLPREGWLLAEGSSSACHDVGGDYFDLVQRGEARSNESWSIVVADVAGKGVGAALVASFLQGAFVGAPPESNVGELLGRINGYLAHRSADSRHATLFCATLEASGRLTYSSAGHCDALLVSAGRIEALAATSMPVGMLPATRFPSETRQLVPGDRLVLYTDGVTEAANAAGEFFGDERLLCAVAAASGLRCADAHELILSQVREFIGGADQQDDLTLLLIDYAGR